ncbi:MAG: AI-2E family transporter, partial [Clostridia bacterium]|nr:AI-2E family transporter [Clostridia bacterium]
SAIVGVTNVIPFFGPIIGAIPSFLIIFIASPGKAFLFLLLILIIQQLDGNVIGPKILGNTTGISSLGVIISIIIMGDLFGVVGMLIGVPLFAVIIALVREFLDHRLKKKSLSTDTADYYEEDSLVDPHEVHEPVTKRLFRSIGHAFLRIFRPKKHKKKNDFGEQDPDQNQQ